MENNIIKQVSLLKQATAFKYIYWKGSQGQQFYRHRDIGKLASWGGMEKNIIKQVSLLKQATA
jgi:hypothetical protein